MGREELGLTSSQFTLQNWMAPQRADPSLASTKRVHCPADREQPECNKALVPYLCGSSQLLRTRLLFPGSLLAPQEVIPRASGLLGCGPLQPGMQGGTQDKYPECSSSETTGLAASWQSGPASAPPSQEISTIRKSSPSLSSPFPLAWRHSSSEYLSPPDPIDSLASLTNATFPYVLHVASVNGTHLGHVNRVAGPL